MSEMDIWFNAEDKRTARKHEQWNELMKVYPQLLERMENLQGRRRLDMLMPPEEQIELQELEEFAALKGDKEEIIDFCLNNPLGKKLMKRYAPGYKQPPLEQKTIEIFIDGYKPPKKEEYEQPTE